MNLNKLFQMQEVLDNRIYDRFPELKEQDNLDWKILALQVELGELANEWRGFKKWSEDQKARTEEYDRCEHCSGSGIVYMWDELTQTEHAEQCQMCEGGTIIRNPLLEEYVDCLHFILSIGNNKSLIDYIDVKNIKLEYEEAELHRSVDSIDFNNVFIAIANFADSTSEDDLIEVFKELFQLGSFLGFTWEQIEQAYLEKNKINHERQEAGY